MSGCVNCVWDVYRDELEEWAGASREAETRGRGKGFNDVGGKEIGRGEEGIPTHVMSSMDDDGGGSETNWSDSEVLRQRGQAQGEEDLFKNVPVGIREFMRTEKRLKERHAKERERGREKEKAVA